MTGRAPSDPAGVLRPEAVLKAGDLWVNGQRYGDYAGTVLDPVDGCTAWPFGSAVAFGWGTWVGSVRSPGC